MTVHPQITVCEILPLNIRTSVFCMCSIILLDNIPFVHFYIMCYEISGFHSIVHKLTYHTNYANLFSILYSLDIYHEF